MSKGTCSIDGCDREHYAHGVCQQHYSKERRAARPVCQDDGCERPAVNHGYCGYHRHRAGPKAETPCSVENCDTPAVRVGMCNSHYRAQKRADHGPCSIEGCTTKHQVRGLCLKHYHQVRRHGSPIETGSDLPPIAACSVEGCDETVKSRGMCGKHYARDQRAKYGACVVEGCDKGAASRHGHCAMHYARKLAYGTTGEPPPRKKMDPICSVEGCGKETRSRGYCTTHWARWRKHGSTDLAEPPSTFHCRRCATTQPRSNYEPAEGCCTECAKKVIRDRNLFRSCRVFAADADAQEAHQGYMCAICGLPSEESKRRLHVDHCHETGVMRGRLCSECNLGLGKFQDDPHILEIAAAYLRAYREDPQTA